MLNLFKKKQVSKPVSEIIEEIHETFYTEVDRLLESALKSNSLETDQQDLIEKCNRLKAIGFTNTKEVKEAEVEISRLDKLRVENRQKKNLLKQSIIFLFVILCTNLLPKKV